jgi:hypothetical protein
MVKIPLAIDKDTGHSMEASRLKGLSPEEVKKVRSKTWICVGDNCGSILRPVIPTKQIVTHWKHLKTNKNCKAHESWPHYHFKWMLEQYHQAKSEVTIGTLDLRADSVIENSRANIAIEGQTDRSDNISLERIVQKNQSFSDANHCPIWFYITNKLELTTFAKYLVAVQGFVPFFNAETNIVTVIWYKKDWQVQEKKEIHISNLSLTPWIAKRSKKHYRGFDTMPVLFGKSVWIDELKT